MTLAKFTETIGILLNNSRGILLRSPFVNMSTLLFLFFKIRVKFFSSFHVATVETQRYAFLLFSVILTVVTGEFFVFRVSCLLHATSFNHRKLFCMKSISCIKLSALVSKDLRVYDLILQCFLNCGNFLRCLL